MHLFNQYLILIYLILITYQISTDDTYINKHSTYPEGGNGSRRGRDVKAYIVIELCHDCSICIVLWEHREENYILSVVVREGFKEKVSHELGR